MDRISAVECVPHRHHHRQVYYPAVRVRPSVDQAQVHTRVVQAQVLLALHQILTAFVRKGLVQVPPALLVLVPQVF